MPPIAIFFCLAAFAFSGSTRFAITRSPRFLLPRCLRGGASVVVAGGVAAGGGTAPPAALSP